MDQALVQNYNMLNYMVEAFVRRNTIDYDNIIANFPLNIRSLMSCVCVLHASNSRLFCLLHHIQIVNYVNDQ